MIYEEAILFVVKYCNYYHYLSSTRQNALKELNKLVREIRRMPPQKLSDINWKIFNCILPKTGAECN